MYSNDPAVTNWRGGRKLRGSYTLGTIGRTASLRDANRMAGPVYGKEAGQRTSSSPRCTGRRQDSLHQGFTQRTARRSFSVIDRARDALCSADGRVKEASDAVRWVCDEDQLTSTRLKPIPPP